MSSTFRALRVTSFPIPLPPRLHFPTPYLASNFYLREERMTTAWEPTAPHKLSVSVYWMWRFPLLLPSYLLFLSVYFVFCVVVLLICWMPIWFPKLFLLLNASHVVVMNEINQNELRRSVIAKMCSVDLRRGSLGSLINGYYEVDALFLIKRMKFVKNNRENYLIGDMCISSDCSEYLIKKPPIYRVFHDFRA